MTIPRRPGLVLLISVPLVVTALGTISFFAQRYFNGQPRHLNDLLLTQSGWFICGALAPMVVAASRRWPLTGVHFGQRSALHLGFALVYWAAAGSLFQGLLPAILDANNAVPAGATLASTVVVRTFKWFIGSFPVGSILYFSIVGAEHAFRYFIEGRARELRLSQVEERLTRARLSALQNQVNPHFLFNALNTIAVRARAGDGRVTARLVEQLSEILRRTLSRDQTHEISLSEEVDLVEQYLAIEQARFADRLRPSFEIDEAVLGAAIPPFSVQHLAENALRHGITRRSDAGRLNISARRSGDWLEVMVTDDGIGLAQREIASDHVGGLAKTRERLQWLYGERATLSLRDNNPNGTTATLRIPYHEVSWKAENVGA